VNTKFAQELEVQDRQCVAISEVEPFSQAYEANIQVSDSIQEIDGNRVTSQLAFERSLSELIPGNVNILKANA